MNQKILIRFNELEKEIEKVLASKYVSHGQFSSGAEYIDNNMLLEWNSKVKNLISLCSGQDSLYFKDFVEAASRNSSFLTNLEIFNDMVAIFNALKNDYENGYLTSFRTLVTAEVFDNELDQAQELLDNKYHVAAAVIAGTVLETSLRELCDNQSPKISYGKLDKMNADLKKAGVYNQLQSKRITALADIRNSAAHGKVSEFTHDDVQSMIKDIESFLINYLTN
jgi:hypothetical protein